MRRRPGKCEQGFHSVENENPKSQERVKHEPRACEKKRGRTEHMHEVSNGGVSWVEPIIEAT